MNDIGLRIKARRIELNLTQKKVKEQTGISSGNQSDIENGNRLPSTPALISLSKTLNCTIDWILKGDATPKKDIVDFSDSRDSRLLRLFSELSENDKEIIIEHIEFKLSKYESLKGEKLLNSKTEATSKMA